MYRSIDPEDRFKRLRQRESGIASARPEGSRCGVLLIAVAEGDGKGAEALTIKLGENLQASFARLAASHPRRNEFYAIQAVEAAAAAATRQNAPLSPEFVLLALIDQRDETVDQMLQGALLDKRITRRSILAALGLPQDLPPLPMPPLTPAGTMDRDPLEISDLPAAAWDEMVRRQASLPIHRLRTAPNDLWSLLHSERRAADRAARRRQLSDDERHSLQFHHISRVTETVSRCVPQIDLHADRQRADTGLFLESSRPNGRVLAGITTWLSNRRVGVRDVCFRVTARR